MKHSIKVPTTVPELGKVADELDKKPSEVCVLFENALGKNWWKRGGEDVVVDIAPEPPTGYVKAKGRADLWTGPAEIIKRGWIITPAWNATTGLHTIELWTANHEPPTYANLSPAAAIELAADLIAAARAV